jgi:hypothetical protein
MKLIKWAVIIAAAVAIGSVILAVVAGFGIALAITGAIGDGFYSAGKVHHIGSHYYVDIDDLK